MNYYWLTPSIPLAVHLDAMGTDGASEAPRAPMANPRPPASASFRDFEFMDCFYRYAESSMLYLPRLDIFPELAFQPSESVAHYLFLPLALSHLGPWPQPPPYPLGRHSLFGISILSFYQLFQKY